MHPGGAFSGTGRYSLVDYNRSGMPLLEIVTEPDLNSAEEAYDYLTALKSILKYLEVSDCDMEKGSLRCDANISLKAAGQKQLGTKVELKNMNSFKNVRDALEYEVRRQAEILEEGGRVAQETRLWDAEKAATTSMRTKEEAEDYRYFPEPDLVPFVVDEAVMGRIKEALPELPKDRQARFVKKFGLSEYDAGLLTSEKDLADYFERCAGFCGNRKAIANWLTGEITARMNLKGVSIEKLGLKPEGLASLVAMIDKGTLSGKMAKEVLAESMDTKTPPEEIVKKKGLSQIQDASEIEEAVKAVLERETKSAADYRSGKRNALIFLIGQVMKETKGKANPVLVNEILKKILEG